MKLFIAHRRSQQHLADRLYHALRNEGYEVFFSGRTLRAGEEFRRRLVEEIHSSDIMLFLLSQDAVEPGAYTLSELNEFAGKWRLANRLVAVPLHDVPTDMLPAALRETTILPIEGDTIEFVRKAVNHLAGVVIPEPAPPIPWYCIGKRTRMDGREVLARANKPVTTRFELFVGNNLVAEVTRPALSSIAYGAGTIFGRKNDWTLQDSETAPRLRATLITGFVDQYIELDRVSDGGEMGEDESLASEPAPT
jgi:hypothetical protein